MALAGRISRLERKAGPLLPRCPSCGVFKGWVPYTRWVDDLGVDLDPTCPSCGFPLDATGDALMSAPPTVRTLTICLARENSRPLGITGWVEGAA